jgi:hypothetical protein
MRIHARLLRPTSALLHSANHAAAPLASIRARRWRITTYQMQLGRACRARVETFAPMTDREKTRIYTLAKRLGVGRKEIVYRFHLSPKGKPRRCGVLKWSFTPEEMAFLLALDKGETPAGPTPPPRPRFTPPEEKIEAYARELIAEGVHPLIAKQRARATYEGRDSAPNGRPQAPREMRLAWLDQAASSRGEGNVEPDSQYFEGCAYGGRSKRKRGGR